MSTNQQAYLILENGTVFKGIAAGADTEAIGELVFTTGMGGYIETLTDPSYYGQLIMQTFPLIGNYGWIGEDAESEACFAGGYICRELAGHPSNFRSQGMVNDWLVAQGIPAITGVDTRAITQLLREAGVMAAAITRDPNFTARRLQDYRIRQAVAEVSRRRWAGKGEQIIYPADNERFRVALIDYGAKGNIIRELNQRGCTVVELPYNASAERILASGADGVLLSNGPGDPEENVASIAAIRELLGRIPIFGICLGHQLLALAQGGRTIKLKYGHRGANQPAREAAKNRVIITCQNHGYAVDAASLAGVGVESFANANDHTNEGMDYPGKWAFSVQFHPEACSGPWDGEWLFDDFMDMMGQFKQQGGAAHA